MDNNSSFMTFSRVLKNMVKASRKLPSSIEFFKVFLSSSSSCKLSLPPAFVMRVNQTISQNATLKDYTGKIWDVHLQKTETGLIIGKGWQEFVHHHSLVDADFLLFKYNGNSEFYVKVFGRNGLKKRKPKDNKVFSTHVKEETETEIEEEKNRTQSTSDCKRKFSEMAAERTRRSVRRSGGSVSKWRRATCSSGGNQFKSRHSTVTKYPDQECKMDKAPAFVKPKNPYFVVLMTRTALYQVENTNLRDERGKLWPVKVNYKKDGRITINDGWLDFHRKHNVAMGDKIIFELMPTENNLCNLIQVVIDKKQVTPRPRRHQSWSDVDHQ
ncbi:putative B3 domain-containing protein At5g66980 isoform X2 [Jatropha curcas]|uniref:putative B3 domain-containing protein At5g66980 isoform X2 n=1 Tax=Jatropha curcas TaxID=180498 RepID=UPI0009D672E9|nr:putative B3 domain-containing protein At5g66980 isoform X2 [Jatropha curcas]